ncbi:hypothetical protein CVIRNUC_006495 [Coccomyxa viridis]|uniref:L-2-hydroxyglutarate dehydrogenase, mitochondrial n=1 Tax=Coccomyxa viridis TaxID=1274662 RepID=A0AAV1I8W6_9CHLO|nr:hypothetical protein CVIRNUC_006495 [Coccomyxa viridis]
MSRFSTSAQYTPADAVVVGAGIVGLAIGRALALTGRKVIVLEAADAIGTFTSSRNSEVVHSGIYYAPGSLKAKLSVDGNLNRLEPYCREHGVPFRRLGKLLVATDESQIGKLRELQENGRKNGVHLEWLEREEALKIEPHLHCVAALWSPNTAIVDSHRLMSEFQGDIESRGGSVALNSSAVSGGVSGGRLSLDVRDSSTGEVTHLAPSILVNTAGLQAQEVAGMLRGLPAEQVPKRYLARGCYFSLSGKPPFKHLIYPMPEEGGLGAHLTLDLAGQAKFGPDVEWVDSIDYTVDPGRAEGFYHTIRRYWPSLPDGALQPSYSGIRPKVSGPGDPNADFRIEGPKQHGIKGLVNLFGIESPGLTASMSIGDYVKDLLGLQEEPAAQSKL